MDLVKLIIWILNFSFLFINIDLLLYYVRLHYFFF
jgi:hypothetical protein